MISSCCGASNRTINFDADYMDMGMCPECKEHCEFLSEDDFWSGFDIYGELAKEVDNAEQP